MEIFHLDVFTNKPFSGNGLCVVFVEKELTVETMQKIACEYKQFETIFVERKDIYEYSARIFTVKEELDFAGHPILGAAAVIHSEYFNYENEIKINMKLNQKEVKLKSDKQKEYFEVIMNQGLPEWGKEVSKDEYDKYCKALNLDVDYLDKKYPMQIVSTGLPYLLIPVQEGLSKAKIVVDNFESLLAENGAKFVYVFDINKMEGRTWDNFGNVEDVATGSAAGPMGAYLYKHSVVDKKDVIKINQGSYLGRPSILKVSCDDSTGEIFVSGDVVMISKGKLL